MKGMSKRQLTQLMPGARRGVTKQQRLTCGAHDCRILWTQPLRCWCIGITSRRRSVQSCCSLSRKTPKRSTLLPSALPVPIVSVAMHMASCTSWHVHVRGNVHVHGHGVSYWSITAVQTALMQMFMEACLDSGSVRWT